MSALLQQIHAQVRARPHAPAVLADDHQIDYATLWSRAGRIAAALHAGGVGVGGGEPLVALAAARSPAFVEALLGAWLAGAALLPLDLDLPAARLAALLDAARPAAAIADERGRTLLARAGTPGFVVDVERARDHASELTPAPVPDERLAYVIYTSGSTGAPKGVEVCHRGLAPMLAAQVACFEITPSSRIAWLLSPGFDATFSDIGTALVAGAALIIVPRHLLQRPAALAAELARLRVTHADLPPALLPHLDPAAAGPHLRTVVVGGEVCAAAAIRAWTRRCRVVSVYGPTEATVCTSMQVCDPGWTRPLLGPPMPHVRYRVTDDDGTEVAPGGAGELWIGGAGLARGYRDQPALTATRFVIADGARWFRTGDRVRIDEDGALVFLGRIDRACKIAGQLVHPEEIEHHLRTHPAVSDAVVIAEPGPTSTRTRLRAAVTTCSVVTPEALRAHLAASLPPWMVPHELALRDRLPRSAADKRVSSAGEAAVPCAGASSCASLTDALLVRFRRVLDRPALGADDDFFAAGGDSLAVIQLVASAAAAGIEIGPEVLHEHRTARALAAAVGAGASSARSASWVRQDVGWSAAWQARLDAAATRDTPAAPGVIVLTGATGFFGARVLAALLTRTDAEIRCLVRARDDAHAASRVRAVLAAAAPHVGGRVSALAADLARPRLGLAPWAWAQLEEEADAIVHCAAEVDLVRPYEALRPANVGAVIELCRLQCAGRPKALHHASTLAVFVGTDRDRGIAREDDDLADTGVVYGGYAQSKWAAEVLLRGAGGRAGPLSIHRLGLLIGDQTGVPPRDWLTRLIRAVARLGCAPRLADDAQLDFTPVAYAAHAMAHLASIPACGVHTFHLASPAPVAYRHLLEAVRRAGVAIDEVDAATWSRRALDAGGIALLGLARRLDPGGQAHRTLDLLATTGIRFDDTRARAALRGSGIRCAVPDPDTLERYVRAVLAEDG